MKEHTRESVRFVATCRDAARPSARTGISTDTSVLTVSIPRRTQQSVRLLATWMDATKPICESGTSTGTSELTLEIVHSHAVRMDVRAHFHARALSNHTKERIRASDLSHAASKDVGALSLSFRISRHTRLVLILKTDLMNARLKDVAKRLLLLQTSMHTNADIPGNGRITVLNLVAGKCLLESAISKVTRSLIRENDLLNASSTHVGNASEELTP